MKVLIRDISILSFWNIFESASSSDSDVDCYAAIVKLLYSIFNTELTS
jgi:hypothetical protein